MTRHRGPTTHEQNYDLKDPVNPARKLFNGPLCVKTIIGCAHIDTKATAAYIRSSLAKLPAKIAELDYDIDECNLYVKLQRSALTSCGEESSDLLVNIFEALLTVPDDKFNAYIDNYTADDPKANIDYVLLQAGSKYRTMKREGKYNVPSKADKKIIVLSAEFALMEALSKAKLAAHERTQDSGGSCGSGRGGPGGQGRGEQGGQGGRTNTRRWAWKNVAPLAGAANNKAFDVKTYYWCTHHIPICSSDLCRNSGYTI
jgi:hypothetical protein